MDYIGDLTLLLFGIGGPSMIGIMMARGAAHFEYGHSRIWIRAIGSVVLTMFATLMFMLPVIYMVILVLHAAYDVPLGTDAIQAYWREYPAFADNVQGAALILGLLTTLHVTKKFEYRVRSGRGFPLIWK